MSKELTAAFDYKSVDDDTRRKLICLSGQVKRHEKDFISAGMEIGQAIAEAHDLLAGDGRDGKFKQWIELETGLSRTTAYDWMHAYNRAKKCPVLDTLPATVTCLLAAPSVPDEAIKDFAKQIDKGARPTVAAAKATIDKFRELGERAKQQPAKAEPDVGPQRGPATVPQIQAQTKQVEREVAEAEEQPVGKLFSELLEHLRQCTLLLDRINKLSRNDKLREEIFNSLEVANEDAIKWRKAAK